MTLTEEFTKIYEEQIHRQGSDKCLQWLNGSDFFTAPASTRYHLACEGGLVQHSINVYKRLATLCRVEEELAGKELFNPESIAICALLHDACKINFYKTENRNSKNEAGQWVKIPFFTIDDTLPYGHGEKSVYIVSGFFHLEREEAMAIRWHMGGFDDAAKGNQSLSKAFEMFPLAVLLHIADIQAAYLDEVKKATI
jgi:hypothetical protein